MKGVLVNKYMSLESINNQETGAESLFGNRFGSTEESGNFPGQKIVSFKDGNKLTRYALSRDSSGNLQGSSFELQEYAIVKGTGGNGYWKNSESVVKVVDDPDNAKRYRVGPVYKINQNELDDMEAYLKKTGRTI